MTDIIAARLALRAARDRKAAFEEDYEARGLWTRECDVMTSWDYRRMECDMAIEAAEAALAIARATGGTP